MMIKQNKLRYFFSLQIINLTHNFSCVFISILCRLFPFTFVQLEINILEKLCVKLFIYRDHAKMHGQQNIKLRYDTMYCYDVVGYSPSDVTSGALQV